MTTRAGAGRQSSPPGNGLNIAVQHLLLELLSWCRKNADYEAAIAPALEASFFVVSADVRSANGDCLRSEESGAIGSFSELMFDGKPRRFKRLGKRLKHRSRER